MGKQLRQAAKSSGLRALTARVSARIRTRSVIFVATSWLVGFLILESFLFVNLLQNYNYLETFPSELVFPTLMHLTTALIVAVVLFVAPRPVTLGSKLVSTILVALLFADYQARLDALGGVLRAVLPILPSPGNDLGVISLVLLLLTFALAIWVGTLYDKLQAGHPKLQGSNTVGALSILVAVLFIGQATTAYGVLSTSVRESRATLPAFDAPKNAAASDKPDIYYFVLDRYTNKQVLQDQFAYDNSDFVNFLRDGGFTVPDTAYANYPYTAMSVASTMTASYTKPAVEPFLNSNTQSRTLYHNLIYQSPVIKALKQGGYTYYNVGAWYGTANRAPLADVSPMWDNRLTLLGKQKNLHGLESIEFSRSPYFAFSKMPSATSLLKLSSHTPLDDTREQLNYLNQLTTSQQSGGRFVFSHLLVPHEPFYFNADGSLSAFTQNDSNGLSIKDKYTHQVTFINNQMKQIVSNIQKQSSGKAVIIFSSDEGPYPDSMTATFLSPSGTSAVEEGSVSAGSMAGWPTDWLQMKYGILQAAHIPLATQEDLANVSSVNLFRIVLNRYLGYELPYLPNCQYGLSEGSLYEYRYTNITNKLNPNADPACATYQTSPTKK